MRMPPEGLTTTWDPGVEVFSEFTYSWARVI